MIALIICEVNPVLSRVLLSGNSLRRSLLRQVVALITKIIMAESLHESCLGVEDRNYCKLVV